MTSYLWLIGLAELLGILLFICNIAHVKNKRWKEAHKWEILFDELYTGAQRPPR